MSFLLSFWWSCTLLHIPFIAYRQIIIRAHVDDNILEFSGLLIALFTLDMLCWIISLIVLLWCLCCLVLVCWCWPLYQSVNSFVYNFKPKLACCCFRKVCTFPYLCFEISHHCRVVVWFVWSLINVIVEADYVFFWVWCCWCIYCTILCCSNLLCTQQVLLLWVWCCLPSL